MKHQCLYSIWVVFYELPDSSEFQNILWEFYHFNCHLLNFADAGTVTHISSMLFFQALLAGKKNIIPEIFHAENYQFKLVSSSWKACGVKCILFNNCSFMRLIYLVGDLHLADYTEISFLPLYWQGRVTFLHFADSFDPGSNKANPFCVLRGLCLSVKLRKEHPNCCQDRAHLHCWGTWKWQSRGGSRGMGHGDIPGNGRNCEYLSRAPAGTQTAWNPSLWGPCSGLGWEIRGSGVVSQLSLTHLWQKGLWRMFCADTGHKLWFVSHTELSHPQ